ncbi:DNA-binding response regulator [Nocardia yunnanensis]|uniref:DNA-binding response regulator n=1 Tax=Nocardia yunnanensis TaxID=2382165 RepID=A0A386ZN26_9NOCA|nr:response regulator transcription factor [Nocardia yunnanensis]AYF79212.1 DNA-binding response regulator [Nocardia yunnanensis]
MIGVLLVDDQRLVRAGLRMLVEATADLRVVGEAADGLSAVRAAAESSPDLVLMDLRMPGMDGVAATREIRAASTAKVLVLTTFDDDEHLFPALAAGASGYLVKDTDPDTLLAAIRRVMDGELLFSPPLLRRLIARAVAAPADTPTATVALTAREEQVLDLLGQGCSNTEIAQHLHLGVTTVKKHVAHLMDKTGCDNRVRLAVFAVRRAG